MMDSISFPILTLLSFKRCVFNQTRPKMLLYIALLRLFSEINLPNDVFISYIVNLLKLGRAFEKIVTSVLLLLLLLEAFRSFASKLFKFPSL